MRWILNKEEKPKFWVPFLGTWTVVKNKDCYFWILKFKKIRSYRLIVTQIASGPKNAYSTLSVLLRVFFHQTNLANFGKLRTDTKLKRWPPTEDKGA